MTKLAEALILRADMQKRLAQLKARIERNVKVQEGDAPAENPAALMTEFEAVSAELTKTIQRINRTNSNTPLSNGLTLADALAERDTLKLRHAMFSSIANAATVQQQQYSRSEIRFVSVVDVAEIQQQADSLARQHRELDALIQAANWATELSD